MNVEVIIVQTFKPAFKRLRKKYRSLDDDMAHLIADLRKNPLQGISIGHAMRKMRLRHFASEVLRVLHSLTSKCKTRNHPKAKAKAAVRGLSLTLL